MLHLSPSCNYYLFSGHADMRKSFDGLCGIIKSQMALNVLSGAVFIFMNRRRTQVKLLLWEGDGFSIYYKRLEKGTFELPGINSPVAELEHHQLQFILQGVSLRKVVYRQRLKKRLGLST
jgi:transposase